MNDTLYHYIDPGFSHTQVGNYTLLLLLSRSRFSLAIMHGAQLMVWRMDAPLAQLTQPGEVQEVLNFGYQEVICGIRSWAFTLVPQSLLHQNDIADIARFLDVQPTDTIFAQPLIADNYVVFKVPEVLTTPVQRFDLQKAVFGPAGWLQTIAGNQPSAYHLYINIHHNEFDIAYFRQGKLLLFNTFEFTHEDELAYYSAFVCQQLKLDMSMITAILSGNITPGDNRYHNLLGDFFKAVETTSMVTANIPQHLPKHQLLALTTLTKCASLADA